MADIQRWKHRVTNTPEGPHVWHDKSESGEWVRYADHVEVLRQAEQQAADVVFGSMEGIGLLNDHYRQGQRDALAGIEVGAE